MHQNFFLMFYFPKVIKKCKNFLYPILWFIKFFFVNFLNFEMGTFLFFIILSFFFHFPLYRISVSCWRGTSGKSQTDIGNRIINNQKYSSLNIFRKGQNKKRIQIYDGRIFPTSEWPMMWISNVHHVVFLFLIWHCDSHPFIHIHIHAYTFIMWTNGQDENSHRAVSITYR